MSEALGIGLQFSLDLIYSYDIYRLNYRYHHQLCYFTIWAGAN